MGVDPIKIFYFLIVIGYLFCLLRRNIFRVSTDCYFLFFDCYWIFILLVTEENLPSWNLFMPARPLTGSLFFNCLTLSAGRFDINMLIRDLFEGWISLVEKCFLSRDAMHCVSTKETFFNYSEFDCLLRLWPLLSHKWWAMSSIPLGSNSLLITPVRPVIRAGITHFKT